MAEIVALTILQPWATLIAHGPKRIENREWKPPRTLDWLAIHAGATPQRRQRVDAWGGAIELAEVREMLAELPLLQKLTEIPVGGPRFKHAAGDHYIDTAVPYGAIVAVCRFGGIAHNAEEAGHTVGREQMRWFTGTFGWVLRDVTPIDPVACKGAQGLWPLPPDVLAQVRERYRAARPTREQTAPEASHV